MKGQTGYQQSKYPLICQQPIISLDKNKLLNSIHYWLKICKSPNQNSDKKESYTSSYVREDYIGQMLNTTAGFIRGRQ